MLTQDQYVKGRLVELGWRFGQSYSGGHMAGQLVMHTLANRVRVGWGSWLQTIDRVPLFMAERELPKLNHDSIWEPNFVKLLHTVEGIYDSSTVDLSKGALYWGDLSRIERPWFAEKIIQARKEDGMPVHQRVCDLNSLSFFN